MKSYSEDKYDPDVNPTVTSSFITAAFRFGHSLLPNVVERWSSTHKFIGSQRLSEVLKRPFNLYKPGWFDQYVLGLINQVAQSMDSLVTQEVTNHLFQRSNQPWGMDLASINLQRAREHGVPSYNQFREWCGLTRMDNFSSLLHVMANSTVHRYNDMYDHPDDIDLWSAGVAENSLPGSMVGPTFNCIIARTFKKLKIGDRFWYENKNLPNSFTPDQLSEIRKVRLSRLLCDTSDEVETIQIYSMVLPDPQLYPGSSATGRTGVVLEGGGVALFVRESLQHHQVAVPGFASLEVGVVRLLGAAYSITIATVYGLPGVPSSVADLAVLRGLDASVVLGDRPPPVCGRAQPLHPPLSPTILPPPSFLDLIRTTRRPFFSPLVTYLSQSSDNSPVTCDLQFLPILVDSPPRFNYGRADWPGFQNKLAHAIFPTTPIPDVVELDRQAHLFAQGASPVAAVSYPPSQGGLQSSPFPLLGPIRRWRAEAQCRRLQDLDTEDLFLWHHLKGMRRRPDLILELRVEVGLASARWRTEQRPWRWRSRPALRGDQALRVGVENTLSSHRTIRAGVPQGSCLYPILYSLFMWDMPIPHGTALFQFADETAILAQSPDAKVVWAKLTFALRGLLAYLRTHSLAIQPAKMQAILFTRRGTGPLQPLRVEGTTVQWSPTVR
uniref:(California timema) hypothetical protein n=2 Tax=Timema TaxID=61471 RepID=A0A7R9J7B4_TIMCA|nr:unnamed protein product [Timema californicum]